MRYFAGARAAVGRRHRDPRGAARSTSSSGQIVDAHGEKLERVLTACSFLVDGTSTRDRALQLSPGAVVDVLPPFAGEADLREDGRMSIFEKVKAKAEELLGRAEQVYGESHGDAAATVAGEAHVHGGRGRGGGARARGAPPTTTG